MRKDFALCFSDNYVPYACVTIKSIVDHMCSNDDVYIHILSDHISENHKKSIARIVSSDHCKCKFYLINDKIGVEKFPALSTWSIYTWYRLLLPKYINVKIKRILYLDCDVIVNDNLDFLFSMDMDNKSIAACVDIQAYNMYHYERLNYDSKLRYICAGVLLMNLDKWRKEGLAFKIIDFAKQNVDKILWPDQDSINYICKDDKIILPSKYGVLVPFFRDNRFIKEHLDEMDDLMKRPAIIHYAGYQPWVYPKNKSMHADLWWKTYNSLHAFHKVKISNILYFLKYCIKVIMRNLKLIKKDSNMYYSHPRVKEKEVRRIMETID